MHPLKTLSNRLRVQICEGIVVVLLISKSQGTKVKVYKCSAYSIDFLTLFTRSRLLLILLNSVYLRLPTPFLDFVYIVYVSTKRPCQIALKYKYKYEKVGFMIMLISKSRGTKAKVYWSSAYPNLFLDPIQSLTFTFDSTEIAYKYSTNTNM
jgi:hypothetical protein